MRHVSDMWFEFVSKPFGKSKTPAITRVLVVETPLLLETDEPDTGELDDLDHALREEYPTVEEIRFVPKPIPKGKRPSKEARELRARLTKIGTIKKR